MPDQQVSGSNKTNQLFSLLSKHAGGSKKLLSMGKEKPLAAPQGLVSMPTAVLPEQSTVATASSTTMPKEANTAEKQVSVPEKSPFSMPVIDQDSATEQVSRRGKLTRSASKNSMNNLEEVNQFNQRNLLSSAPTPDAPVHVYAWSSKQEKGIPFKVEGDPAKKARRFMQASLEDKAKALRVFKVLTDYTKGISNLFAMNKGDVIERDTQLPTQVNTAGRASEIQDAATWILPASRGGRGGIRGRGRGGFRGRGRGRGGMQGGL
jgi:hypothetical protein